MALYEVNLPSLFPYRLVVPGPVAAQIASFLSQPGDNTPDGSSFAVVAGIRYPGCRVLWLSQASHDRLKVDGSWDNVIREEVMR